MSVVLPPRDETALVVQTAGVVEVLGVVTLEGHTKGTRVDEPAGEYDLIVPGVTVYTSISPRVRSVVVTLLG